MEHVEHDLFALIPRKIEPRRHGGHGYDAGGDYQPEQSGDSAATAQLRYDLSCDFPTLEERIYFRSSGYHDDHDVEIFEPVVSTVLHQREVKFVYQKPMENGVRPPQEQRHVQPRFMVRCDNVWYLFANDPSRDGELRKFALHCMKSAEDTGKAFLPAGPFDIDEVLKDAIGINTDGHVETVELLFRPSVAGLARELLAQYRTLQHRPRRPPPFGNRRLLKSRTGRPHPALRIQSGSHQPTRTAKEVYGL